MFQGIRDVKGILPELIICSSNQMTAELDCCKGVKPIKYEPGGLGIARPVKNQ